MASGNSTSTSPPPGGASFDPVDQISFILAPDGQTQIPFSTAAMTTLTQTACSLSILYGTQIGACLVMLAVVLAMTPRARFRRAPTLISVAALALNAVRMLLLALFFTSSWMTFYVVVSGDPGPVRGVDYGVSAAATALSVPVTLLILAALLVQAWSMLQLWPAVWKVPAAVVSLLLAGATVAFNMMTTILQTRAILATDRAQLSYWARMTYLGLITASICWFCFLFNVRLVMHMWSNRSILPSLKGLKAMDVLVITNGILMFVPVTFSGLEFGRWDNFEAASLTQTSVIIVLPLGTLVAQRLANPAWFGTTAPGDSLGSGGTGNSTGAASSYISHSVASTGTGATKRPLLMSVTTSSSNNRDAGIHRYGGGACGPGVSTHIAAAGRGSDGSVVSEKGRTAHADHDENRRRASGVVDLERGHHDGGGVRVDYGIERREERVPTGSS